MSRELRPVESGNPQVKAAELNGPDEMRSSRIAPLICLLLALVTLSAFWSLRLCDFVNYDDPDYVTENLQVRQGLTWPGIAWAFGTTVSGNWHPVTLLSHMLDCQCYGLDPGRHHLTSLLFHVANTLLLFGVLRRLTAAPWRSAFVAAFFALHPLHVESVAWISERKDVLSTFFFMLTLWAYARYAQEGVRCQVSSVRTDASRRFPSSIFYLLSLLCFALGLMSKPMLVTLPLVLLLLDYWPLGRLPLSAFHFPFSTPRRLILEKVPFFLLSATFSAIAFRAQQGAVVSTGGLPVQFRVSNALISYFRYLRKTFWPDDLAVFYPHPGTWPWWQVIGAVCFLTAVSLLVVGGTRRRPYLLTGWLWFLGTLGPVIGLLQVGIQAMADRYTYIPLIGVFIMLVWLAFDFAAGAPRRVLGVVSIMVVVLSTCFAMTRGQLRYWQNSEMLFHHALLVTKDNHVAHNALGLALYLQGKTTEAALGNVQFAQAKYGEAIEHLREAVRLKPDLGETHQLLAQALVKQGKLADAVAHFSLALQHGAEPAGTHYNFGIACLAQGQIEAAIQHYRTAIRLRPEWPEAFNNLAWLLATHPEARYRNGSEAVPLAERSVELTNRKHAGKLDTLAAAYAEAGRFSEAVETARQALAMARAVSQTALAGQIEKRLQEYQGSRPWREPSGQRH